MWKDSFVRRAYVALFFFSLASAQDISGVQASSASLIFNGEGVIVNPGERLHLDCGVEGKYRSCIWEKGGENPQIFQVEDVYEGFFNGMSKPENTKGNECGIVINSVAPRDNGDWTCKVFVVAKTLTGTKKVVVTVRPQQPTLNLNEDPLVVPEGTEREIECTVPAARPAARIRWFIGSEDVTSRSTGESVPVDELGTYRSVSTLKYKFQHPDDRKNLKCIVEHQTLQEPEYAERPLDIRYKPYPISSTKIYSIPLNAEYEIKYNFTSNPVPEMVWYINGEEIKVPGESGRYQANIKTLMDNIYMATLRIKDFSDNDVGQTYRLHARNELGERNFDITLSTGPAPPDSISSGTIIAISVVIVIIIVLLIVIGMMKYRQIYCFGSKDKIKNHLKDTEDLKEEHDTESAAREPNNSKKATNLLKNIRSKFPIPSKKGQKEPRLDKLEEGEAEGKEQKEDGEEKGRTNPEVVYAELELGNGDRKKDNPIKSESTEYAEIIGTVPDNKTQEKKE